jgi:hypothetical protein
MYHELRLSTSNHFVLISTAKFTAAQMGHKRQHNEDEGKVVPVLN